MSIEGGRDVDEATPRPWRQIVNAGFRHGYVKSGDRTVADCRYVNGDANAALIVEAVNAYDRLRAIEAAARELTRLLPVDVRLTALRAALSEAPSDAR
jgi:hypothetical protein